VEGTRSVDALLRIHVAAAAERQVLFARAVRTLEVLNLNGR
jgi:hypothetical protein